MAIHGSSRGRSHVWLVLLAVLGAALVSVLALAQWDSPARADGQQKGSAQQITLERSAAPAFQRELTEASNGGVPEPQIIGGRPVPDGKYPFMAFVKTTFSNGTGGTCGGTLIDQDSVLTAAHCVVKAQTTLFSVDIWVGGTVLSQRQWQARKLADGWFHDKYKPPGTVGGSVSYDVAVLKLDSPVRGIQPIKLNTPDPAGVALETPGRVLTATGWGDTSVGGSGADRMNEVQLIVIPDTTAQQAWTNYFPPIMVATDAQQGRDIAGGDSGGPLFNPGATPTQVGIVAFSDTKPPAPGSKPTAYTDINNQEIRPFIVDSAAR